MEREALGSASPATAPQDREREGGHFGGFLSTENLRMHPCRRVGDGQALFLQAVTGFCSPAAPALCCQLCTLLCSPLLPPRYPPGQRPGSKAFQIKAVTSHITCMKITFTSAPPIQLPILSPCKKLPFILLSHPLFIPPAHQTQREGYRREQFASAAQRAAARSLCPSNAPVE